MINLSFFENLKCNYKKLLEYGFKKDENSYTFSINICENEFLLIITITHENKIKLDVIENSTNEKLDIFYVLNVSGAFVGKINTECEKIVNDIALKCFEKNIYKSKQTKEIIEYIANKYNDNLEFLWKNSFNAIWRRKDNQKWYGALLIIKKNKLGFDSNEKIEILDLRTDNATEIIDNDKVFGGYHMNKSHWITICLDYSLPTEKILKMIDISYKLAKK